MDYYNDVVFVTIGLSRILYHDSIQGWIKRGPSGIIGTNIADAKETVATIMNDFQSHQTRDLDDLDVLLKERGTRVVWWKGYQKLDSAEKMAKRSDSQPREKIVDLESQLKAACVD